MENMPGRITLGKYSTVYGENSEDKIVLCIRWSN